MNIKASEPYPTIQSTIGNTPLIRLTNIVPDDSNTYLLKLEGNNPAGSVKDRAALNMILQAQYRGDIKPGDTLIEATSGNTGIALAMVAATLGYEMILIMPADMSEERQLTMSVYGAELVLVSEEQGMEGARDLGEKMQAQGKGFLLDQFSNPDNPDAHYLATGPEIWQQSEHMITHFVSAMGTTGTIMGTGRYLKEVNPEIQIIGVRPASGASIPGIRRWPEPYLPKIFDRQQLDKTVDVTQLEAEKMARELATGEGLFCGISSGGAFAAALSVGRGLKNATIVSVVCDRGDRYLSTSVFGQKNSAP
ncbi:MAG: cysteine synthase CysM [Desulfobacterales bacterium]|nr:cysteine synthase CysM [Desulfobacterales bacterium]